MIDQWKSESTISSVEINDIKIDELIHEEVIEQNISEELEDFDLPEWAIEPSSNRSEEDTIENLDEVIVTKIEQEIMPPKVDLLTKTRGESPTVKQNKIKQIGPRSATVDHKPKPRVRRVVPPDEYEIRTDGLRDAAVRWREIVEQRKEPMSLGAIPSKGKDIPDFQKTQQSIDDLGSDIRRNTREIDEVWMPKSLEEARRHEIIHTNSKKSTSSTIAIERPPTAREFASASHKQRRDLSIPTTRNLDSTELPENFYDRLAKLVEKGENIGEIMSVVERSPSEALQQLQKLEDSS